MLTSKIKGIFGQDSLDWIDRRYLIDWYCRQFRASTSTFLTESTFRAVAILIWGLSGFASHSPVFEREFMLDDPLINHPHTHQQYVPSTGSFSLIRLNYSTESVDT
jgi:diacylglycerol diphosphate phosphatase/phosphatidate phosphatase